MTTPNLKDAPEWAQWVAMDDDGEWWWYEKQPELYSGVYSPMGGRYEPVMPAHVFGDPICLPAPPTMRRASMSEWQPIESAPTKPDDVLLYCADTGEQFVGFPRGDGRTWRTALTPVCEVMCEPTHWMPLPPPPKEGE